ncbi:alpha/beta-hydrolase [Dendrothele bispora CBS 962.96]|uniref:Alpha/beta-hydrolase n=1 Tax=Dendrothele bispora (strain CBS 962.96) TaxID=1314807 RepID=A0A4S8MG19_DENBC|nr:alpha/beta-hydrolase [Dendrothele bispora CBS 962.96]
MSVLFKQIQSSEESSSTSSSLADSHQLSAGFLSPFPSNNSSNDSLGSFDFSGPSASHLDSLGFGNSTTSLSTTFSPAQLGVRSSQATASDLKIKRNLHGEYAANLDSFCAASTEERQLMTAAWTLELLMKIDNATKTQSTTMSEKLQKDAREYAFLVLLSWKLSSYSGKVSDAVIQSMRDTGIRDVPPENETALLKELGTLISEKLTGDKCTIKKKIYDSLSPTSKHRNLALLTKAIIGQSHNVPLTVELYVRVAFLRSVAAAVKSQPTPPIIDLGYASYQGTFDSTTNVTNYHGIRYARPPLGDLRFRAPQPPANVTGVQQANTIPPSCLQGVTGRSPTNPFSNQTSLSKRQSGGASEDCLFLNVFFPGLPFRKKVYRQLFGSWWRRSGGRHYTIQTWSFGFLAGSEVKENGDLNAGLLDQHFALQWVRTHISKFGGDPSKVTIWGESAVVILLQVQALSFNKSLLRTDETSPPLFRAAITSSTFLPSQYKYNDRIPEAIYSEVVAQTNCGSASDTLACLRSANANTLETANSGISQSGFFGSFVFVPVVDGTFITQRPTEALKLGKVNGAVFLGVTNTNEGVNFVDQTARQYAGLGTPLNQVNRMMGEAIFICPTYYMLNAFPLRSFKGEFAIPPATHSIDQVYYWQSSGTPGFQNADFIKAFSQSFLSFAMSLDPNVKFDRTNILPRWDRYTLGHPAMIFNRTEDGTAPDIHESVADRGLLDRCSQQCSLVRHSIRPTHGVDPTFDGQLDLNFTINADEKSEFSLLLVAFAGFSNGQSGPPVIDLGYASYQGTFDSSTNVTNYLGIRYASPPVGNLRFRAPQPPANITGVQRANTAPPGCMPSGTTEDCLFLNVYFPGSAVPKKGLPTIVWIHGGGYRGGSSSTFHGADLVNEADQGVVVVTIQYRLGLFGFLAGTEVKENGDLNAGLLDQHFALQWVQTHISKFGGDPSKVTIWGESAGAGSVLQQVIAQDGRTRPQLFRAAISSSTFLPSQYQYNDKIPEATYNQVVNQANCASASDTLACLRRANANTLKAVETRIDGNAFRGVYPFAPVVDGTFITQRASVALREGKANGQAYLGVINTNEGVSFVNQPPLNTTSYVGRLFPNLEPQQRQEVTRLYAGLGTPLNQVERIVGEADLFMINYDKYYVSSCFHLPDYLLNAFPLHSYKGEFAIPPATHGIDQSYYWQSNRTPGFRNADFIKAFSQSFLAFAMSLDPNDKFDQTNIAPRWDRYIPLLGRQEMVFNRTEDGSAPDIHEHSTDQGLWRDAGSGRALVIRLDNDHTRCSVPSSGYCLHGAGQWD